ncbi:ABC transporter ATP-binding protein [Aestuariibius sp. 2305UL40-4]|uniref:ABC transporter ATP-binding protein n=1 Tax=Aestuariibius violaceus TaxID=3234132 RepID=UPI00345E9038
MSEVVLELSGLRKAFGALVVTDGIDLDLRRGECHALIGPNGAGKSTLIHQISGVLQPDAGRISFEGRDVTALSQSERAVAGLGRSFQITSILPEFTVLENVALAAQMRAGSSYRFLRPAAREAELNDKAMEALGIIGLARRADIVASTLSHGEKRLLELAIAIAGEPRALLLDEPMAGMGRAESATLTQTLLELKAAYPMLLIEHDMEAVFRMADRVSVLVAGAIVATGTPDEVRDDPQARAAYLGDDHVSAQ